jgi:hypothetical protein
MALVTTQTVAPPKRRQKLTLVEIFNMSFGFLGIQFGFALQNANVSRIFQTLGAKVDDIPILWIAAPFNLLSVTSAIEHGILTGADDAPFSLLVLYWHQSHCF